MKRYILQIISLIIAGLMQYWNYFNYYFLNFPDGGPAITPYVKLYEDVLFPMFAVTEGLFMVLIVATFYFKNKTKDIFIAHLAFVVFFLILSHLSNEAINMWI